MGELGTSKEIHSNEKKVLLAAAKAQCATGAPIFVHVYPWGTNGTEIAAMLSKQRIQMDKLVICHSDVYINMKYIKDLLSKSVLVVFDSFGSQHYIVPEDRSEWRGAVWSTDRERVKALKVLIDEGYERQILISSDVCRKTMLHHYGGWGYDYILRNIVPMMVEGGIDKATVDLFLKESPKKLLNIT